MTEGGERAPAGVAWLKDSRHVRRWTQAEAARHLGISQGYISLLEHGARRVPPPLLEVMQRVYEVPATELPLVDPLVLTPARLAAALARLGYPPLAHLCGKTRLNPATLLLGALRRHVLEARLSEALPWVALQYVAELNWTWLLQRARVNDVQNRLGYVLGLADEVAQKKRLGAARRLRQLARTLEPARLAREDTLCRAGMTEAERKWLRLRRSRLARHWNLLTDLKLDALPYTQ